MSVREPSDLGQPAPKTDEPPPAVTAATTKRAKRGVSIGLAIAVALWGGTAVAGMGLLLAYKQAPGQAAKAPATFPAGLPFGPNATLHTLVMVVHPKCTCSRASMGELAKLMTRLHGKVEVHVLFVRPEGVEGIWEDTEKTDLYKSAVSIEGVEARIDRGGVEAERFGAATSGQTYLYSPEGKLLFSGGITRSRGHHGDNAGSSSIAAIVVDHAPGRADTPTTDVYGCEISDPNPSSPNK